MIKNETLAEQLERQRDEKDQIRRVAGVDGREPMPKQDLPCQAGLVPERRAIFEEELRCTFGFDRQVMPVDVNALQRLFTLFRPYADRAYDGNLRARVTQCTRFLPNAPVERHGQ